MASQDPLNTELESFRRRWLSDLRSRTDSSGQNEALPASQPPRQVKNSQAPSREPGASSSRKADVVDDDDDYLQGRVFDEPPPSSGRTLDETEPQSATKEKGLVSALDHYEEAMEKEASGNMGDSLKLYRKAYRMDNRVDRRYREKHFPAGATAPKPPAEQTAPDAEGQAAPGEPSQPQSIGDLLASFANLKIEPVVPEIEGMPQPPCPIADLPDELITHILQDVAVDDVGDFVRLSQVCKHFAYLVSGEQRIWRRVALGSEVGFGGMHYHWQKSIQWGELEQEGEDEGGTLVSMEELAERRLEESLLGTKSLVPVVYPTWKNMFRSRPRIRFNGCYISTANYVRTGQASTNQNTWGSPIHIVTYYRYLRFFRDGTAISLLTTTEPADVVHHMTPDALRLHRGSASTHGYLPSAVMHIALPGRWRLSSALDHPEAAAPPPPADHEGDLHIETEGVGPKYTYHLEMSLRSAGRGAKNNKLVWRGFYSYNKLTDDWAEFRLKNDKPFFFSRVKSYGMGRSNAGPPLKDSRR